MMPAGAGAQSAAATNHNLTISDHNSLTLLDAGVSLSQLAVSALFISGLHQFHHFGSLTTGNVNETRETQISKS